MITTATTPSEVDLLISRKDMVEMDLDAKAMPASGSPTTGVLDLALGPRPPKEIYLSMPKM